MDQNVEQMGQFRPERNFIGFIVRKGTFNIHTEEGSIDGTQLTDLGLDNYTFKLTVHEDYSVSMVESGGEPLSDEIKESVIEKIFGGELIQSDLGSQVIEGLTFKSIDTFNGESLEMFLAGEHEYESPLTGLSSLFGGMGSEGGTDPDGEGNGIDPNGMNFFGELMKMFSQSMPEMEKVDDEVVDGKKQEHDEEVLLTEDKKN